MAAIRFQSKYKTGTFRRKRERHRKRETETETERKTERKTDNSTEKGSCYDGGERLRE